MLQVQWSCKSPFPTQTTTELKEILFLKIAEEEIVFLKIAEEFASPEVTEL